jgi:pimeloyl-ACP methyl ester carboxylesterase
VRGIEYNVSEWGDPSNRLLVMLHGWGDAGSTFQFVVDELKNDWFVVAPDWRGFGSTKSRAKSYWFPDYLADLDALLAIYSPDDAVAILGHSMGGNVAGLYAGIFPERVERFINIEGFGLTDRDPEDAPANYRRWVEKGRLDAEYRSYDSYADFAKRIQRQNPRISAERALFVATEWASQGEDGLVTIKADPAHKLPNPVLYRRSEAEACWRQTTASALLVVGAESQFRPDVLSSLAPDGVSLPFESAKTEPIEGAGHMIHFDQPAALAALIEEFLRI